MTGQHSNFQFLRENELQLFRLGALSASYFTDDPNTALIKLRQFGEALAQLSAARFGLSVLTKDAQTDVLRRLKLECGIPRPVADLFHALRLATRAKLIERGFPKLLAGPEDYAAMAA